MAHGAVAVWQCVAGRSEDARAGRSSAQPRACLTSEIVHRGLGEREGGSEGQEVWRARCRLPPCCGVLWVFWDVCATGIQ